MTFALKYPSESNKIINMEKELQTHLLTTPDDSHNPKDTISAIEWYPKATDNPFFACTSWDSKLNFYTLREDGFIGLFESIKLPSIATNMKWVDDVIYYGSPDGTVNKFDIESEKSIKLGTHSDIVLKVSNTTIKNAFFSASSDGKIKLWDVRERKSTSEANLNGKVSAIDFENSSDVLGYIIDNEIIVSSLNSIMTPNSLNDAVCSHFPVVSNTIAISKNNLVVGTVDGEVIFLPFNGSTHVSFDAFQNNQVKKSFFNSIYHTYNVNCLDIHSISGNKVLIGGNKLILYDNMAKMISKTIELDDSITACKYSHDGKYTAFATGNDYSLGQYDRKKYFTEIFLYKFPDTVNL